MPATVSVRNLIKTYDKGKVLAVDKVSFDVKAGELFGLIGPDGAGKSSVFRILTTVLLADSGTATRLRLVRAWLLQLPCSQDTML